MIYFLSCEKYPRDEKVIPSGSDYPIDTFKVELLSDTTPDPLPTDGSDVEGLADSTKFAYGSTLLVRNGTNGKTDKYIYGENGFERLIPTSAAVGSLIIDTDGAVYLP